MMSELQQQVEQASSYLDPQWSEARSELVLLRVHRRRRQQRVGRALLGLAAAAAVAALGATYLLRAQQGASEQPTGANPSLVTRPTTEHRDQPAAGRSARASEHANTVASVPAMLRFTDGSSARALDAETGLVVREVKDDHIRLGLDRGSARFAVTRREGRRFVVVAGAVSVQVVGTVFVIARSPDDLRVAVEEGRVLVRWHGRSKVLGSGEVGRFPLHRARSKRRISRGQSGARMATNARVAGQDWRPLARAGRYQDAQRVLSESPPAAVRDEPGDLLLAADAARNAGASRQATGYLKRLLARFATDSRAPLAAFTLGRLLLRELGRPAEAAEAFEQTVRLAPDGPLAEDALARQIEAYAKAGSARRASERARQYLSQYPDGRRLRTVRRYGSNR